jgi:methyltransferase (TIGR00027 family)
VRNLEISATSLNAYCQMAQCSDYGNVYQIAGLGNGIYNILKGNTHMTTTIENAKPQSGATAFWTAAVRAQETSREAPLISDPWAAALAGEQGLSWLAMRPEGSGIPILLRTRYFDDFLQKVVLEDDIRQVILMAAGLDTRAFRLRWPSGTKVFELDQAEVLDYKEETLRAAGAQPACQRIVIRVDLTGPWQAALQVAGYDPMARSAWLLEGFLFYLPSETVIRILEQVAGLARTGSWLGFDIINGAMLTSPITRAWIEMQARQGAPWIGTLDEPVGVLASLGWSASLTQAGAPDANHGRWSLPVIPVDMPGMPHNWFVTARKN